MASLKQEIEQLAKKYPGLESASVRYTGTGGVFDDFWDLEFEWTCGLNKQRQYEEKYAMTFIGDADNLLNYALDHSEADCEDDGCEGSIIFNFDTLSMEIDNYYFSTDSHPSGLKKFSGEEVLT